MNLVSLVINGERQYINTNQIVRIIPRDQDDPNLARVYFVFSGSGPCEYKGTIDDLNKELRENDEFYINNS